MEQNTALLIMDIQTGILEMLGDATELMKQIEKAIKKAREKNIPIFYITLAFRPGMPEISPAHKSFSAFKERLAKVNMEAFAKIPQAIAPQQDDIVVTKRRASAFTGSDLEVLLRSAYIRHLVMTGISTSGVVLSTMREATDKDYGITILSDCCADRDEEVHRVLTTKIFPGHAAVCTVEEWL